MVKIEYILDHLWLQQKIAIGLLLLSLFVGIWNYKKLYGPDRTFIWIITISLIVELGGIYIGFITDLKNNYFIYNLLTLVSFPIFLNYYRILKIKFPFKLLVGIFILSGIYSILFESFNGGLYFISNLVGSITIVIGIYYFFSDLLNKRQLDDLFNNSPFLFSCGLMLFYTSIIPYILLNKHFLKLPEDYAQYIVIAQNIILYTFYILAFVCSHRKTY